MGQPFDVPAELPLAEQAGQTFPALVRLMQRLLGPAGLLQLHEAMAMLLDDPEIVRRGECRKALREQVIAGIAGADFYLIAFAAETFDGLDEENFCVGHSGRS